MQVYLDTVTADIPESLTTNIALTAFDTVADDLPDSAKVWAAAHTDQTKEKFNQLNKGDAVFLYHIGEGEYLGGGTIHSTVETDWFLENYWDSDHSERTLAYIFSEFKEHSIDVRDFNELLGYQPIHHPHGLQRVAESKNRSKLLDEFGFDDKNLL